MSESLEIKIGFFGGFRKYGPDIAVLVPHGCGLATLRQALSKALDGKEDALINDSVFADEEKILAADFVVLSGRRLSILPPVCGG